MDRQERRTVRAQGSDVLKQEHRLGPTAFGKVSPPGKQALVWNAALLFGVTQASADTNFRLQVEYEF